jgi:amino-acid N-acetyltransferase
MENVLQTATVDDVPGIATLVDSHAKRGLMLPRPVEEIRNSIKDWVVVIEGGEVVACGSLLAYSPVLSEIRSLAVDDSSMRNGLGMAVVKALIDEARSRGVRTLFSITRAIPLFEQVGFQISDISRFPDKERRDCRHCSALAACDRVTVELSLIGETDRTFAS